MLLNALPTLTEPLSRAPEQTITTLFNSAGEQLAEFLKQVGSLDAQTTCAAAWISDTQTIFAHIGDSRIYRISGDHSWHTKDHSLTQSLIDSGRIDEEEALLHSSRHILTKTIGRDHSASPSIEISAPLQPDETLILCSDGFWANRERDHFFRLAVANNIQKSLNASVTAIVKEHQKSHRALDNVTVQIVRPKIAAHTLRHHIKAKLQKVFF